MTITPDGAVKSSEIAETVFAELYAGLPTQALRLELTLGRGEPAAATPADACVA